MASYRHMIHYNTKSRKSRFTFEGTQMLNSEAQDAHSGGPRMAADDAKLDFSAIWTAIRQGKWIILAATVLVAAAVAAYTISLTPTYSSHSLVSLGSSSSAQLNLTETVPVVKEQSISTETGLLSNSIDLAERVVERLEQVAQASGTGPYFPVLHPEDPVEDLPRRIAMQIMEQTDVRPISGQEMIQISVSSSAPEEAATIANLYAEEYQRFSRERARASLAAAREYIQEQVDRREEELRHYEARWEAFALDKDVVTLGPGGEKLVSEYSDLSAQRDAAEFKLEREIELLEMLHRQLDRVEPNLRERVMQEHSTTELETGVREVDRQIAVLREYEGPYYAVNPDLKGRSVDELKDMGYTQLAAVREKIAYFEQRKEEMTNRLVTEVVQSQIAGPGGEGQLDYVVRLKSSIAEKELTLHELQNEIAGLDARLGTYDVKLEGIPRQQLQRQQFERQLNQAELWYNRFAELLQQTKIAEESELGDVTIVREAFVPVVPDSPNVRQNVILGILLGFGIGLALAFVRHSVSQRLETPADVREKGYTLIGVVPSMDREIKVSYGGKEMVEVDGRRLSTRLMTLLDPWSSTAENFRLIRTNIQQMPFERPVQVLLVTSPESSDGKSVTAMNLAISTAQSGRRTLMIDADLRRPALHKMLPVEGGVTLRDALSGEEPFEPSRYETSIEGLSFISAGRAAEPPAELLGSHEMQHFLSLARDHYEVIILDSPPVLAVADAIILAPRCDAALVVIAANKTDLRALELTQETLRSCGTRVVGTVINRLEAQHQGSQKYWYYKRYAST